MEYFDVVSEQDEVIGKEQRWKIHQVGLKHREIHVYFVTPDGKILFQHRAKDKDTYPDKLTATVGGHVELGATYEETAVKETEEETGVQLKIEDLIYLDKIYSSATDETTNTINSAFSATYAYIYKGKIEDLKVEEGKAIGFEAFDIDTLLTMSDEEKKKFVPRVFIPETLAVFQKIKELI